MQYHHRYVGDWRDNKRCGRGVFTWPDGSYYDGEWESDTRHGKGRLVLAGGLEYVFCYTIVLPSFSCLWSLFVSLLIHYCLSALSDTI